MFFNKIVKLSEKVKQKCKNVTWTSFAFPSASITSAWWGEKDERAKIHRRYNASKFVMGIREQILCEDIWRISWNGEFRKDFNLINKLMYQEIMTWLYINIGKDIDGWSAWKKLNNSQERNLNVLLRKLIVGNEKLPMNS